MDDKLITITAKKLNGLDRHDDVLTFAEAHPELVEFYINCFGAVIDRFNSIDDSDPILAIMPKAQELKAKLAGRKLPTIAEMQSQPEFNWVFFNALKEAAQLMMNGQEDKNNPEPQYSNAEKIGSASVDTRIEALLVGVIGHLIERMVFHYYTDTTWTKDDVLIPLDDVFMLLVAEGQPSPIFDIVASQPAMDETGGIGWIKQERVEQFLRNYQA